MKLYDMDEDKWRNKFERGETWRSEQVYQCKICHAKTNKWFLGGYPGKGPRHACPGDKFKEHAEIESLLKKHTELESLHKTYTKTNPKKTQKLKELPIQIELLEEKINKLRERFTEELDDVKGVSTEAEVRNYYPTSKPTDEKESLH